MAFNQGSFNNQQSNTYAVHALEKLQSGILDIKRPELLYPETIPEASWDKSVEPGYENMSKIAQDWAGSAGLRATGSNFVPTLTTNSKKISNQIYHGGLMNSLDVRTLRSSKILVREGFSSDPETYTLQIANQAVKNEYEKFLLFGCAISDGSDFYHSGFLRNPNTPTGTVVNGGNGTPEWSTKVPEEIIYDLQTAIMSITVNTNYTMSATTVYLPEPQWHQIASTKAGSRANDETILSYVSKYGLPQLRNGGMIEIVPYHYLTGAGVGGTDRMIVCEKKADNYIVANPIDFNIVQVQQVGYLVNYYYEYEISTLLQPWPQACAYFDGI